MRCERQRASCRFFVGKTPVASALPLTETPEQTRILENRKSLEDVASQTEHMNLPVAGTMMADRDMVSANVSHSFRKLMLEKPFMLHRRHDVTFNSAETKFVSNVSSTLQFATAMLLGVVSSLAATSDAIAQPNEPASKSFQRFVQQQGRDLRVNDVGATTRENWEQTRQQLRANLLQAWGGFPETACPLEPRSLGDIKRDGYRVERIVFQTLPGVWMTANAYVPEPHGNGSVGKLPAVLCVHGHWAGAKQDPVVQTRCIGLAKLGFFVLCVDAFGAGERGIGKKLGEYHGEMTGATLLPLGRPLSGIQVYENMRAVDYIRSRSEVDPDRIGITGASGGGNQSMYAGAFDERLRCVVPTCSVGTYQSYLSAACCMCEVVPGAMKFTEEGDVLSLAARRGLMVTSATQDAFQFSVGEAKKSFERVALIAKLFESTQVKHTIIESPHHYNQPMREAMYGWMTLHLKGQGDGHPIPEPEIKPEDPETIRCYPGESRPDDYLTIPQFAAIQARELLAKHVAPQDMAAAQAARADKLVVLEKVLGGMPAAVELSLNSVAAPDAKSHTLSFISEPGVTLRAMRDATTKPAKLAILLDLDSLADATFNGERATQLRRDGWTVVVPELRATGQSAPVSDKVGHAPDHNSAEWSLWLGRPLLGQWVWDVRRTFDAIKHQDGSLPNDVQVVGVGSAGVVALCAAALDERITQTRTIQSLASYVSSIPYRGQRLGLMAPGILRDVGDISHVAALIAPRKITINGGVTGGGQGLTTASLLEQFAITRTVYSLHQASAELSIGE
jgi:cephalosporin-C deacetylase-like acetyl esterase